MLNEAASMKTSSMVIIFRTTIILALEMLICFSQLTTFTKNVIQFVRVRHVTMKASTQNCWPCLIMVILSLAITVSTRKITTEMLLAKRTAQSSIYRILSQNGVPSGLTQPASLPVHGTAVRKALLKSIMRKIIEAVRHLSSGHFRQMKVTVIPGQMLKVHGLTASILAQKTTATRSN